jgi:putative inorganic carbon (HCO3(-)) transporter
VIVLAIGLQQHFGGLEETRRWFFAYEMPNLPQPPTPEFLQKLSSNRIYATLFYPNTLAGAILLLLPIVSGFLWRLEPLTKPARALLVGLIGAGSLACLYWSGSKAGWLILLVIAVLAFLNAPVSRAIRVATLALLLLGGLAGFYAKNRDYFARGATSASARLDYWKAALQTAGKHPVLGSGPGTFGAVYRELKSPEAEMARLAHNDYLQQASDSGLLGGVGYLVLVGGSLVLRARSSARSSGLFPVWLGLVGLALQGVVEFGLFIPALAWPQFLLLGWLWSNAGKAGERSPPGRQGPAAMASRP